MVFSCETEIDSSTIKLIRKTRQAIELGFMIFYDIVGITRFKNFL